MSGRSPSGVVVVVQVRIGASVEKEGQQNRLVFLDGRPHPPDVEPTWMGHSIGIWEGDTLVVDSIGFNDKSWLAGGFGLPHTVNMRIRNGGPARRWVR